MASRVSTSTTTTTDQPPRLTSQHETRTGSPIAAPVTTATIGAAHLLHTFTAEQEF